VIAHAEKQYRHLTIQQQRERLPVCKLRRELLYLVEKYQTTIVVGQTGSGKTTRKSYSWIAHSRSWDPPRKKNE
jgi:ATP-dependent RNA helicase DDX35